MTPGYASDMDSAAEIERLQDKLRQAEAQLRALTQDAITLRRAALATAGPALRAVPSSALRAFIRLLEDMGPDGVTEHAWTGKALGEELGLARANHERLIAPLVEAGVIEPAGEAEHKARRYRLASSLNAQSVRVGSSLNAQPVRATEDQTRNQRAFRGNGQGQIVPFPTGTNAQTVRVTEDQTRNQCAQPSLNAQLVRAGEPLVCTYVFDSDPDPDPDHERTDNGAGWSSRALEVFGSETKSQGLSKTLRTDLLALPPVEALAYVLHAKAEARTRPAALLRAMLDKGIEPAPAYAEQAARKLKPPGEEMAELMSEAKAIAAGRELWAQLQVQFEAFDSVERGWLELAEPVHLVDGVLCAAVENAHVHGLLQVQVQDAISRLASELAGETIRVEFIAGGVSARV